MSELVDYLILSSALLGIGVYGLLVKRNAIRLLFSIEIIVNAANINLVALPRFLGPSTVNGQILTFFSIAIAAMEAAVGLAIILVAFRLNNTIDVRQLRRLKG